MVQQLYKQGSLFDMQTVLDYGQSVLNVGEKIATLLSENQPISNAVLQTWMNKYFLGTAAEGAWGWKDAYEAVEVAQILYLRSSQQSLFSTTDPTEILQNLQEIVSLCPTQTRRSDEQIKLQQFSTPLPIAFLMSLAAQIRCDDICLEPSAGTGLLAQYAQLKGASLILNELADERNKILRRLFPGIPLYKVNAEQINDHLAGKTRPTVVLMNPPFSASPKIDARCSDATARHVLSALQRLEEGGRLVALTANWFSPGNSAHKDTFAKLKGIASIQMSVGISGKAYLKHGTSINTRLLVVDKIKSTNEELNCNNNIVDLPELLNLIEHLPERLPLQQKSSVTDQYMKSKLQQTYTITQKQKQVQVQVQIQPTKSDVQQSTQAQEQFTDIVPIEYWIIDGENTRTELQDTLYETYRPQRINIFDAKPHPTLLCESAALALVAPPIPTYKPLLPLQVVKDGLLSEPQIESIIYAGQAHSEFLAGEYIVDDSYDNISIATSGQENAIRFRKGWYLADSTGCGKGRQIAGMILDGWCQNRKKAIWISKNTSLFEDAQRDWRALGGNDKDIIDLSNIKLGSPIPFKEGIFFLTYSTLRSEKGGKSRLKQILEWAGEDFEGIIAFDECHAMGNPIGEQGNIGMKKASLQGIFGLRLQNALPLARVVYISATGASKVSNLCYANRLGLWLTGDFPFNSPQDFVSSIEAGGIAAMEVLCRDLKGLGLYLARSLSFEGVECEPLEVELTPTQENIYDSYAEVFQIIHSNLHKALEACNVVGSKHTYNRAAKMSAISQFESHKQRFFDHLLTGMKCPTLIKAIEADLAQGYAVVVQLVSTNEELLKRRLNEIPKEDWKDINVDLTPREYVMDYLMSAFPIHLHEVYSVEDGEQ
jgi:hypothetical protein